MKPSLVMQGTYLCLLLLSLPCLTSSFSIPSTCNRGPLNNRDLLPRRQQNIASYEQTLPGERKARLDVDETKGRMLRATTNIRMGELILEESAILRAPRGKHHMLPTIAEKLITDQPHFEGVIMNLIACRADSQVGAEEEEEPLYSRMFTNAHEIRATGEAGIFPLLAMVNHDCEPNAKYTTDAAGKVRLRARREIEEGNEVTLSYIDISLGVEDRRAQLESSYGFVCQCQKCCRET